jgi:uncharacterized protein
MDQAVVAAVAVVMALGLAGTVVPLVPGLILIWAAALGYGFLVGFGTAGLIGMTLITALLVVGTTAKYVLARRGAGATGAPRSTITAAALLGLVGFFVVPVVGFPLGAAIGIFIAERHRLGDSSAAWASTKRVLAGFGRGALVEMGAGVCMIVCWAGWVWLRTR